MSPGTSYLDTSIQVPVPMTSIIKYSTYSFPVMLTSELSRHPLEDQSPYQLMTHLLKEAGEVAARSFGPSDHGFMMNTTWRFLKTWKQFEGVDKIHDSKRAECL